MVGYLFAKPGFVEPIVTEIQTIEASGEVYLTENEVLPSERSRVAAIIIAFRNLSAQYFGENCLKSDGMTDSIIVESDWEGLRLTALKVRQQGVVLSEEVNLILTSTEQKEDQFTWQLKNLKLVNPHNEEKSGISELESALTQRGLELQSGKRIGRNIWQETIVFSG